jgi:hypothetical protein
MPTELRPEQAPLAQRLLDMESSIEALNVRIARLAIGLGVSLQNEGEIARVMSQQHPAAAVTTERRDSPERRGAARTGSGPDRRMAQKMEELRGLLVLRYGVEARYVDEVGVAATRQILTEAEAHLVRDGFKPGADGIDLDRLFKES